MNLVDSHCHLDCEKYAPDLDAVLDRAARAGVTRMLSIGTGDGPPELDRAVRLAERYPQIYATVGIHPHDAAKATAKSFDDLRALGQHHKVVAFGEIGLDYHYDFSPREIQRDVFVEQLKLARELELPITIHTREAWDDTLAALQEHWHGECILHCFTGDAGQAGQALALGYHLAFGGVLTFRTAENVREAAKITPDDRLLVETDAPYLAPLPWRGKRNEPAFMAETVKRLAEVRGTTPEHIAEITTANFERLCLHSRNGTRYTEGSHGY
ncbi:MAG: TatD DNase family protein [Bryobacterales bacterium]|jgi:TatD DNase family protein|nr:TatD DNase family protein [Bryobacterales bacterium]